MEWYVVQSQDLNGIFSSLGSRVGDEYEVGEKCLESLGEILSCLVTEDRIMRNFRRALGIAQVIQMDLIPLLIHAKADTKIVDATIRVLVNLTLPVECLIPIESVNQTESGPQIIADLNGLLLSAKQEFVDPRATFCLVQRMRATVHKGGKMSPDDYENIGNCLLLLRNILHIPENKGSRSHSLSRICHSPMRSNRGGSNSGCSKQNLILWNLFAQNLDKVLLHLMTCPQRAEWEVPMVQLVALTFKDQRMAALLKMFHQWLETSMSSESSEDNESNTSPQPLNQGSGNSSPVLTSEATSDSSDNGVGATEGGKGDRSKTLSGERNENWKMLKCQFNEVSTDQEKDQKNEITADQPCTPEYIGMTNSKVGSGSEVEAKGKHETALENKMGKGKVEEDKSQEMVREQGDHVSGDADSGVFSQNFSQNSQPYCERKIHSQQCNAHRYPHHNCAHPFQLKNGKKGLVIPKLVSSSPQPKVPAASEQSDCGYSTQVENQPESLSTSSNEDEGPIAKRKPGHQKHHSMRQHHKVELTNLGNNPNTFHQLKVQKRNQDLRRKRLVKRARIHSTNIKAMVHHTPTDEDISNLLKEFTLDFMLQAYGLLVSGLHIKLLSSCSHRVTGIKTMDPPVIFSNSSMPSSPTAIVRPVTPELPPPPIDTSHFFWLITFFLRFSSQLGLEFENISMVLSYDVLSYLVYEGVGLCEEVLLALRCSRDSDLKPCLRRIHLVVTAIREFVQSVEAYGKIAMTMPGREGDRAHLQMLQKQMASTRDLRRLFVLLLQHYDVSVMSRQYLQDIVVTNHVLLLFLESGGGMAEPGKESMARIGSRRNSLVEELEMAEHITHFANGNIVQQYGHLLEAFQENGEFVNDCIFTMLHHIGGGEVNRAESLFQPILLRAFSAMWETDFEMCDDWSDLIEYIIYKFISNPQQGMSVKKVNSKLSVINGGKVPNAVRKDPEDAGKSWSVDELGNLNWFYAQSRAEKCVLDNIVKLYRQKLGVKKTRKEVLKMLFSKEIINFNQFTILKNKEFPGDVTLDNEISPYSCISTDEDVTKLIAELTEEGLERVIYWLQDALLEACYVKLQILRQRDGGYNSDHLHFSMMEPVAYHYALMGQPIPIVPWGVEEHNAVVHNKSFGQLLNCFGIQRPRDDGTGGIYPRIPVSSSPLDLLEAARKLGELTAGKLKFNPVELSIVKNAEETLGGDRSHIPSPLDYISPKSYLPPNPVHEPNKISNPERLSRLTTSSGTHKSPTEINVNMIRSSNIDWLDIVKQSKSAALINNKITLKNGGKTPDIKDLSNGK